MTRPPTAKDLLGDGSLRWLFAGQTASALGTSVSSVAVPLVALQVLDASTLVVSLLTAATWLPWLLFGLPAGAWVDRTNRRTVMIVADVVSAGLLLSVPVAAAVGALSAPLLLAVNLGVGTCGVAFAAARTSWLPTLLEPDELGPGNALLLGGESAAQVAGPGIAGLLAGALGAVAGVLLDALSFLCSAGTLLFVRRPTRRQEPVERRALRSEVAEGARFVAQDRFLRNLVAHGAVSNLALVGFQAVLVAFLVRDVGLSAASVGLLLSLSSVGGVVGASLSQLLVRRLGSARTLVLCKAGAGPWALLIPLTEDGGRLALLVVGQTMIIVGVVAGNVVSGSFRQLYTPAHLLGRVFASMQVVNIGTIPLGAVLAGVLANATTDRTAVAVFAALYAASGLILVLGPLRGRRDLPVRAEAPGPRS